MTAFGAGIAELLERGRAEGLFTAAAAAVRTPSGRVTAFEGTLAVDDSSPVGAETLFDLASVTKTLTAAMVVRLVEEGAIDLDEPTSRHLRVGSGRGSTSITPRMLLTHTAGLPSSVSHWNDATVPEGERLARILAVPLDLAPDEMFRYSCVGYIAAGALAERVTGRSLAELLRDYVTGPLQLPSVTFGPVDPARTAATEDESYLGRGVVRGEVHDELNWYLGGQVGNAGLFATASDVLAFAESFLDGTLLTPRGLALMTRSALEKRHRAAFGHGIGLRIGDRDVMGDVPGFGHTGFTGTMWVVDPARQTAAVLLTNRVHHGRASVELAPFRRAFNATVAAADQD